MLSALFPLILGCAVLGLNVNILNKCPKTIILVSAIGQNGDPFSLDAGISIPLDLGNSNDNAAFVLSSTNEDDNAGALMVGFFADFYYLFVDPTHLSASVEVKPGTPSDNGFCQTATCDGPGCPGAISNPASLPRVSTDFPAPGTSPPAPPLYRCPGNVVYDLIFCPTGQFPGQGEGKPIQFHASDGQTKCLDVQGGVLNSGTLVQIYDCNGSSAQRWIIAGERVQLAGTNYCLDSGTVVANGNQLKIWQCGDPAFPAQQWIYDNQGRVALKDQAGCMDVENGTPTNGNKVQTWQCGDSNPNQIWRYGDS